MSSNAIEQIIIVIISCILMWVEFSIVDFISPGFNNRISIGNLIIETVLFLVVNIIILFSAVLLNRKRR